MMQAEQQVNERALQWIRHRWLGFDFREYYGRLYNEVRVLLSQHLQGWDVPFDVAADLLTEIVEYAENKGLWPVEASASKFRVDTLGRFMVCIETDKNRGCYRLMERDVSLYQAEVDYLLTLDRDIERRFVFYALFFDNLVRLQQRTHFVFPSRLVIGYMWLEKKVALDRDKAVQRFKDLGKKYKPNRREYCGIPLLTGKIKGQRFKTANEYCLGPDYPFKTGELVPAAEAALQAEVPPITPELIAEMEIPREPKHHILRKQLGSEQQASLIADGAVTNLPPGGLEVEISPGVFWGVSNIDTQLTILQSRTIEGDQVEGGDAEE